MRRGEQSLIIRGIALPGADAMATPLGEIPLDAEACATISKLPSVLTRPDVHAEEHSVEVQLPFLQRVLGDFTVVPLVVGDVDAGTVADVLEACRRQAKPPRFVFTSSVAVFGGGGLTNEKAYQLGKFARVALRTSQIDYIGRWCMSSAASAASSIAAR